MSRDDYDAKEEQLGNGTVDEYTFDFKIENANHLLMIIVDDAGLEVERIRGDDLSASDYIDSLDFDAVEGGGTVTLLAVLPTDYRLLFLLANDNPTQPFAFKNKGDFTLDRIEAALDWLQGQVQRLFYWGFRSVKLSDLDDPDDFDPTLPQDITDNPGKGIFINDDGDGFEFLSPDDILEGIAANGGPFTVTNGMATTNITGMTVTGSLYSSARFICEVLSPTIGSLVTLFVVNKGTIAVPAWEIKEGPTLGDAHAVIFDLEDATADVVQVRAADDGSNGDRTVKWRKVLFDV